MSKKKKDIVIEVAADQIHLAGFVFVSGVGDVPIDEIPEPKIPEPEIPEPN